MIDYIRQTFLDLTELARHDRELQDNLTWLARKAIKNNRTIYQEVEEVLFYRDTYGKKSDKRKKTKQ